MSCNTANELKKKMDETDLTRRGEMPNATKPLDQEVSSGWNPKSYKEKNNSYETAKFNYENHKENCAECQI